jgi:hypothetical protein
MVGTVGWGKTAPLRLVGAAAVEEAGLREWVATATAREAEPRPRGTPDTAGVREGRAAGAIGAGPRERRVGVGRPGGVAGTRVEAERLADGGAVKAAERAEASTRAGEEATRALRTPWGEAREREEPSSSTDPRGTRFRGEERTFEWAWFAGPREAPGKTKAERGPPTEDSGAAASLSRGVGAVEERVVVVKTRDLGIAMRETQKPGKGY